MTTKEESLAGIRILTRLGALSDQKRTCEEALQSEVLRARMAGCSWRMIGVALGTSTQAAWEKYRPGGSAGPTPGQDLLPLPTDGT